MCIPRLADLLWRPEATGECRCPSRLQFQCAANQGRACLELKRMWITTKWVWSTWMLQPAPLLLHQLCCFLSHPMACLYIWQMHHRDSPPCLQACRRGLSRRNRTRPCGFPTIAQAIAAAPRHQGADRGQQQRRSSHYPPERLAGDVLTGAQSHTAAVQAQGPGACLTSAPGRAGRGCGGCGACKDAGG